MSTFQPPIRSGFKTQIDGYTTNGEIIGKGATAFVYKGLCISTGELVAIKEIDFARLGNISHKQREMMNSEIAIMRQLSQFAHPNIVRLRKDLSAQVGSYQYQYLILDYCDGEDFHNYLKKKRNILSEEEAKYFMTQFAQGLRFLRFHNVSHRDLKPQNLLLQLVNGQLVLKIADFGFAKVVDTQDLTGTMCGSPLYMAPEIHQRQYYSVKADLWSVGIILYQICCGQAPFAAASLEELTWKLKNTPITFPNRVARKLSPECKDLIIQLLQREPHKRISWEGFFNHAWFGSPITLPLELVEQLDPEFEAALENCLSVAELADELSTVAIASGEALTLYIKFLMDMKQLYRVLPHNSPHAAQRFYQHFTMYLSKANQIAKTTEPKGNPENLLLSKFIGSCMKGSEAEAQNEYEEAKCFYQTAERYLIKLETDALSQQDKDKLTNAHESLHIRIAGVSSMLAN